MLVPVEPEPDGEVGRDGGAGEDHRPFLPEPFVQDSGHVDRCHLEAGTPDRALRPRNLQSRNGSTLEVQGCSDIVGQRLQGAKCPFPTGPDVARPVLGEPKQFGSERTETGLGQAEGRCDLS